MQSLDPSKSRQLWGEWQKFTNVMTKDRKLLLPAALVYAKQYLDFRARRLSCHLQLFFNKSEYSPPPLAPAPNFNTAFPC